MRHINFLVLITTLSLSSLLAPAALAQDDVVSLTDEAIIAPYLPLDAPVFHITISQFRQQYNAKHPQWPIDEFRSIQRQESDTSWITRAASRISPHIYASTALERGNGKLRSIQITYFPTDNQHNLKEKQLAISYMSALTRQFDRSLNETQSEKFVRHLISEANNDSLYQHNLGAIRYSVMNSHENGLTFAIEPIKLTLAKE